MAYLTLPNATDPTLEVATRVRDLLASRLNHGLPVADHVPVALVTGSQVVIDDCCPGYGWVRVVRAFPSNSFPNQSTTMARCPDQAFAVELEVGIARCTAELETDGTMSLDALEDEAILVGRDRSVLFQVAIFDLTSDPDLQDDDGCEVAVGQWTPLGTSGGCLGGSITVTLAYDQCHDVLVP